MNQLNDKTLFIPQRRWGWLLGLGIILIILGCVGLGMVVSMTIASMYVFALLLLLSSLSHLIDASRNKHWEGFLWQLGIGILYLVGAILIFYDPLLASTVITALLAWILIIIGGSRLGMAVLLRHHRAWKWIFVAGLSALILGVLILMQWPLSGLWVIGMFISIDLIFVGITYLGIALAIRTPQNIQ